MDGVGKRGRRLRHEWTDVVVPTKDMTAKSNNLVVGFLSILHLYLCHDP